MIGDRQWRTDLSIDRQEYNLPEMGEVIAVEVDGKRLHIVAHEPLSGAAIRRGRPLYAAQKDGMLLLWPAPDKDYPITITIGGALRATHLALSAVAELSA